ncbi:MAG: phytanoyl-CoA dioxygenase family protein, partial [Chloroflexota bacterium]
EDQKYFFDVTGYLVLEDLLPRDHCQQLVDAVNRIAETPLADLPKGVRHSEPSPNEVNVGDLTSADPLFADLIDLPPIVDILKEIIDPQLRLEISYGRIRRKGYGGLDLHGNGSGVDPIFSYQHFNGKIYSAHTVVAFNLTDVSEEEGGFVCIPGSHKANFPLPHDRRGFRDGKIDKALLRSVPCKAGSAVIFTEALSHGAAPWHSDRERVNLFYKYNHAGVKWRNFWPSKEALEQMTPNQRAFYPEVGSDSREKQIPYPGR